jgi:hypothetical protein
MLGWPAPLIFVQHAVMMIFKHMLPPSSLIGAAALSDLIPPASNRSSF